MNIKEIKLIISQRESHTLEFKKSTGQLKAAFETLCAFLNGQGGTVLIGINDNGDIIGQQVTDNTRQEIAREFNKIEPTVDISIKYTPIQKDRHIIVLRVLEGVYKPYVYDGRAYMRNQSTTVRMPQHRYEQLLVQRGQLNYAWDEITATDYEIADLDLSEIHRTILQGIESNRISADAAHENADDILKRLRLTSSGKPINAAVVLYAKDVRPNYPQCHIKMARFRGTTDTGEFLDNQSYYGNAFALVNEADNFIKRHLPVASSYEEKGLKRIDKPAVPLLAIREALINAICHKDYSNRSSSISIAVYDDRLEIWNFGLLPPQLTIEDLKRKHSSYPRNKLIAEIFYNRGLVERWGTGTIKMIDSCKAHDIPLPEFEEYSGGLAVIFKFKEYLPHFAHPIEQFQGLNDRQREIINLLSKEGSLNPRHILAKLSKPIPERTLRYDLSTLKKMGILDKTGRANATLWFIRRV